MATQRRMNRTIPWLRVAIEGLVIVSSILLAFGIDAWWSSRQVKVERALTLALLEDQMRSNREILVTGDSLGAQGAARITMALSIMSPRRAPGPKRAKSSVVHQPARSTTFPTSVGHCSNRFSGMAWTRHPIAA